jgi:hypothetical protein
MKNGFNKGELDEISTIPKGFIVDSEFWFGGITTKEEMEFIEGMKVEDWETVSSMLEEYYMEDFVQKVLDTVNEYREEIVS